MPISNEAELLRAAIYRRFAESGQIPESIDELASTGADVRNLLDELEEAHHIVRREGKIVLAHPFATRSFRFSVMSDATLWWGGCAWDSFAIPHLLDLETLVATTCPACNTPHAWTVNPATPTAGTQVAHFLTPAAHIWNDVVHACENQQIFCSDVCVDRWLQDTGNAPGARMSLRTLWRLAQHWYEGRLDSPYERRDPIAAADYFRSVGLTGPFWESNG